MMVYVDTSLLAAYYYPEIGSLQAQAYLMAQSSLSISWLTETELILALSRKVRQQTISPELNSVLVEIIAKVTVRLLNCKR